MIGNRSSGLALIAGAGLLGAAVLLAAGNGASEVAGREASVMGAPVELSPFHDNAHNAIVRVDTSRAEVALSFDDGPDPVWTPRFLRLLRSHHAHASFFLIGEKATRHRALVRRELREGNETGNHTLSHPRLTDVSDGRLAAEIGDGARALVRSGAPRPRMLRPPFGAFDERVGEAAAGAGELLVGWDLPLDRYLLDLGPRAGPRALLADLRPGSIILAHDGVLDRRRTLVALRFILARLARRGVRVVTIGRLLADART